MVTTVLSLSVASAAAGSEPPEVVEYGCADVVVIGRVETVNYTDISDPDDLLGHGRFDMQIAIKRVLRGKEDRRVVPASHIAHGQLRDDRDFLMVLSPLNDGNYSLASASLWRSQPRPAVSQQCRDDHQGI